MNELLQILDAISRDPMMRGPASTAAACHAHNLRSALEAAAEAKASPTPAPAKS